MAEGFSSEANIEKIGEAHKEANEINLLVDHGLISSKDASLLKKDRVTELAHRASDLLIKWQNDPEDTEEKIRYLSGKEKKGQITRPELVVRSILAGAALRLKYPNTFSGVVFYGSRNRLGIDRPGGDQDCFLITRDPNQTKYDLPLDFEDFIEGPFSKTLGTRAEPHLTNKALLLDGEPDDLPEIAQGTIPLIWDKNLRRDFMDKFENQMGRPQDFSKQSFSALARL